MVDFSHLKNNEYWRLIQTGLCHTNSLTRKRALYLLKRTVDYFQTRQRNIESLIHSDDLSAKMCLFDISGRHHVNQWHVYFMFIEILEETSVHVIKPVLCKADALIEAVQQNQMHYSWLLVLFQRGFLHESKFIVRWLLLKFLQSNLHLLGGEVSNMFISN